jgi:hypothetical protein
MAESYSAKHFNVTFPQEYVAQVEINRPAQLNAFFEAYVPQATNSMLTPLQEC